MARRYFANFAPTQNLSASITSTATSLNCASFSGWPTSFPFTATIDYGLGSAEIVLVTNISGTLATVTRGYDNSVAVAHAAGATFDLTPVAKDLDEASNHVNSTAGVHGVSGQVVGTSDVQTLSNKTFSGSTSFGTVNGVSATWTGSVTAAGFSAGGGTISGGAAVFTGALSANGATITGNQTVQGNQTVNGSMNVTGNQTNAGTLTASGAISGPSVSGVLVPKQFTNEAAANTAGANVTGNIVYLTAPTTSGAVAGLFQYNGTAWVGLQLIDDTGWTTPALGNSWVGYHATDAQYSDPQYRRKSGSVRLNGGCKSGTAGATIFTLPAGFRPASTQTFITYANNGIARVDILASGAVQATPYSGGTNAVVLLTGISFIAEQ